MASMISQSEQSALTGFEQSLVSTDSTDNLVFLQGTLPEANVPEKWQAPCASIA